MRFFLQFVATGWHVCDKRVGKGLNLVVISGGMGYISLKCLRALRMPLSSTEVVM